MSRLASLFLKDKPEGELPENSEPDEDIKNSSAHYRIMFVDDEPNVLKSMRRIFRQENYEIFTYESADQALVQIAENKPHVIVSDFRMPGMNGADFLKKIKELYPQTIRIMLTGHADVNAVMGAINEGAVYKFITKPWDDNDLRLSISLALEKFELVEENKSLKHQAEIQQKEIQKYSKFIGKHRSQLASFLLQEKIISQADFDKAVSLQEKQNRLMPGIITDLGLASPDAIVKAFVSRLKINQAEPAQFQILPAISELVPKSFCVENSLVPLKKNNRQLIVAMADPSDFMKVDDLKFITGLQIQTVVAREKEIHAKIKEIYGEDDSQLSKAISAMDLTDPTENIEIVIEDEDEEADLEELLKAKDLPPAIRIVNTIISDALRHGASDIHIEPKTKYVMVRYRIDGLLYDKLHIPIHMHPSMVSRIKVMSELDISERRRPQDGRITVKSSTRFVDMRISTLPTINGEKIVMRVLDKNAAIRDLKEIGLSGKNIEIFMSFINQPQGILLVTGPTGSGKTSTLYGLLNAGASITKNIVTIEDPVEYYMSMAEQVTVRHKIGLSFPIVLRAILRQDPNIIMLGEIRDYETAEVAFHSALTGHLVLSTLHTNSTIATITRLRDMGVQAYVISEAMIGIIAQRLVRKVCTKCRVEDIPDEKLLAALKLTKHDGPFYRGAGCDECMQTGFSGRIGLFEVLPVSEEIKKSIHKDVTESELKKTAKWFGVQTLYDDGLEKIREGITTCGELLRVLGPQTSLSFQCPECKKDIEEKYPNCPFCGFEIMPICYSCGKIVEKNWKFCAHCRAALNNVSR
ncbi:ATPase, T2SS/T4P/T4SS family [Desulforegula conservatrix]|uniref:ATPase, T2SS/T4P/T4SS family n=1 Tax=Desulforegula conservatrix TaxID=153026 RepID=UPI0003F6ECD4|nr:ATPase, T2SS/T4P/T4SS family [Desulforegula conservatrix]